MLGRKLGFLCLTPGCSRQAEHEHHLVFRSHQGGDDASNRLGLCAGHHLHCLHKGWMRVTGAVDEELTWELGVRAGHEPLLTVVTSFAEAGAR